MRALLPVAIVVFLISGLVGCAPRESAEQRHVDANTPAGKLGQAAHKVSVAADKAAHVAERKLDKAAHDAKAGWNEDAKKKSSQ